MKPPEMTVAEKWQRLVQHTERGPFGHTFFRLADGTAYEGYILDVGDATVLFQRAPSLFSDIDAYEEPFEVPIEEIDVISLR